MRAQAKINLWLHVLAREVSGYHGIETLFQRLDLADEITVSLAMPGDRSLHCSRDVGAERDNLAFRAAELLCDALGWNTGFHIDIRKEIPAGAGLGGGSADAAATLRALGALHDAGSSRGDAAASTSSTHEGPAGDVRHSSPVDGVDILQLAGQLGADVPFLASDFCTALAWGHGERMLGLPALPRREVVLLVPEFPTATADAYRWLDEAAEHAAASPGSGPVAIPLGALAGWEHVAPRCGNSFAAVVDSRTGGGAIARATAALERAGAIVAGMTGSGSAVFGVFDTLPDTLEAVAAACGCRAMITRTATAVEAIRGSD